MTDSTGLTPEQIASLTRKADQQEVAKTHKSRWLTPNDARALMTAMDHDADEVALGGKMFTIKYESSSKVWVSPVDPNQYIPCGWYTTSLLQSIAFSDQHS